MYLVPVEGASGEPNSATKWDQSLHMSERQCFRKDAFSYGLLVRNKGIDDCRGYMGEGIFAYSLLTANKLSIGRASHLALAWLFRTDASEASVL